MQVFLTNKDLSISAQNLDDIRLNKQITEINQILLTYINSGGGHANHPVNQWYKSKEGIAFLFSYLQNLCLEYKYRFNKIHMGTITYNGMREAFYIDGLIKVFENNPNFKPAYIKGQKGKDQIITTENTYELYQELLIKKWNEDKTTPKWTRRSKPDWYEKENKIMNDKPVRFASEWDGCWFCDCCGKMKDWKTKGYVKNGYKLCTECKDKSNNRIKKEQFKGSY